MHRSLSRPLTILGAERKLFFFAMCLGAATFNLLNSLLGGLLMFLLLYSLARWATETDPQILRLLARCRAAPHAVRPDEVHSRSQFAGTAMLRLSRIFKNYDETGSLNDQMNLYGFIGPRSF